MFSVSAPDYMRFVTGFNLGKKRADLQRLIGMTALDNTFIAPTTKSAIYSF